MTAEAVQDFEKQLLGDLEASKGKRKHEKEEDASSGIEDTPIPADYDGPKEKKPTKLTPNQRMAMAQIISNHEAATENMTEEDMAMILVRLDSEEADCIVCSEKFLTWNPDHKLCGACVNLYSS